MARTPISTGGWTEIVTAVNIRKIGVEGGTMRVITGVTTGINMTEGTLLYAGQSINVAVGETISGWAETKGVVAVDIGV